jgi:hypothetical protein
MVGTLRLVGPAADPERMLCPLQLLDMIPTHSARIKRVGLDASRRYNGVTTRG